MVNTKKDRGVGAASSKVCPRAGFIRLYSKDGGSIILPTNCKTWRCKGCRDRVRALFKKRVAIGCSKVGPSFLITLTYRQGEGAQRHAASVQKDWSQFLKIMKKMSPEISYVKVVEATKKNQPHLHVVMGGITQKTACCRGKKYPRCEHWTERWLGEKCEKCIEHVMAKAWYGITGDSYVVDARPVLGAAGAGAYLSKYLVKGMDSRDVLLRLGFKRFWSCSRNWPRESPSQLLATYQRRWRPGKAEFVWAKDATAEVVDKVVNISDNPLNLRVAERNTIVYDKAVERKRAKKQIGGMYDSAYNRA